MEDCRESLDGESVSGDADEVSSNLDVVELESRPSSSSTLVATATTTTQQISALPREIDLFGSRFKMPVSGPAGILAFYILSTIGFPGLFYRAKSPFLMESTELAKYMAIPLCSIAAFIILRHVCQIFCVKSGPVLPAEQIVMDVKRMNINFTLLGNDKEKPTRLSKLTTSSKSGATTSSFGVSFVPSTTHHRNPS